MNLVESYWGIELLLVELLTELTFYLTTPSTFTVTPTFLTENKTNTNQKPKTKTKHKHPKQLDYST